MSSSNPLAVAAYGIASAVAADTSCAVDDIMAKRLVLRAAATVTLLAGSLFLGRYVGHELTSPPPRFAVLQPSVAPEWIRTTALDGSDARLDLRTRTRPLLAFVLSTSCHFCRANMEVWTRLAADVEARDVEVIVLSTSGAVETGEFLVAHHMDLPVHLVPASEIERVGLPGVPATLVFRPGTRRIDGILGVLEPDAVRRLMEWTSAATQRLTTVQTSSNASHGRRSSSGSS